VEVGTACGAHRGGQERRHGRHQDKELKADTTVGEEEDAEGELRRRDSYREALDSTATTYVTDPSSRDLRVALICPSPQGRARSVPSRKLTKH